MDDLAAADVITDGIFRAREIYRKAENKITVLLSASFMYMGIGAVKHPVV